MPGWSAFIKKDTVAGNRDYRRAIRVVGFERAQPRLVKADEVQATLRPQRSTNRIEPRDLSVEPTTPTVRYKPRPCANSDRVPARAEFSVKFQVTECLPM